MRASRNVLRSVPSAVFPPAAKTPQINAGAGGWPVEWRIRHRDESRSGIDMIKPPQQGDGAPGQGHAGGSRDGKDASTPRTAKRRVADGSRARRGPLRVAIVAFTLLVVTVFWIAAVVIGGHDRERTLADIDNNNSKLALTLSEHAERVLDYADRLALEVKVRHEQSARGFDLERFGREGGINRKIVVGILLLDAAGDVLQVDRQVTHGANFADREHFKVHNTGSDSGRPFVSRPLPSRAHHGTNIVLSRRLNRRDGAFDGVVGVAMDADSFTGFYRDIGLGDKGLISLTGLDGYVRARNAGDGEGVGQDVRGGALFKEYSQRDVGTARFHAVVDGVTRRVAFRRLDGYPLVTTVGVAEDTLLAAVNERVRALYAAALVASLCALLAATALLTMVNRRDKDARALQASEERFRQVTENIGDVFWLADPGRDQLLYVSPAYERLWGRSADSLYRSGFEWIEGIHADDRERVLRAARTQQASGSYDEQYRVVRPDGTLRWVRDRAFPVRDAAGEVVRVAGVAEDITDVREFEQTYRRMVESSPDATFINRGNVILYANPAALKMLRATSADQVVGLAPLAFVHPDDRAAAEERISLHGAGVELTRLCEQRFVALDGTVVDTEISVSQMLYEGQVSRHVVARNVTQRKAIEVALRDSEARYRRLVEESPDATFINRGDTVLYANPAALRLLGADTPAQIIGGSIIRYIHPDYQDGARAHAASMDSDAPYDAGELIERQYVRVDGSVVDVEISLARVVLPDGVARQVVARDISARKRAAAALYESEARLRLAVAAANMTDWEWDIASDQTHWGHQHEQLLGPLPPGATRYADFRDMVHADDRARFLAAGRATMEDGAPYEIEFRLVRTDGQIRWLHHSGRAVRNAHGTIERMVGVTQDVTRRRDIERELAESHRRRAALMESIPAPAWLKDRDGRIVAVNRAWCVRYDRTPEQVIGHTNHEVFPRDFADVRDKEDRQVVALRAEQRVERSIVIDGRTQWFETVKTPIFDEHGEVSGIAGVLHDITARKQIEMDLRASEERFRQFAESAIQIFWIFDVNPTRVVYVNRAFASIWGVAVDELYANPLRWTEAIHPDDRDRVKATFDHWLRDATAVYSAEYRIVRPDGELCWIRDRGTKLRDPDGTVMRVQGIAEDITEQRQAERALEENRQRRDALLESNPDPSWLKDCDSRFVAANRAWFARHRIAPHNIAGKTDADFFDAGRAALLREEDRCVVQTRAVVRRERTWEFGDREGWIETVKAPVLDSAGNVTAIIGISHDITAHKHNELAVRKMNESLAHKTAELSMVNAELEAFSYSVSHDLRAPLRRISGFGNFLLKDNFEQLGAEGRSHLQRILAAGAQMGQLIDDLLQLARISRQPMSWREVNLHALAGPVVAALGEAEPGRRVEVVIEPALTITADPGLMRVVLDNLIGNAWKFTGKRADARIEMGAATSGGERVYFVRDNGAGFDMNYAGKLFAPFQRLHTQQQFEGTGIGLATVKRIIARHEGRIWVESAVDRGTTVYFTVGAMP